MKLRLCQRLYIIRRSVWCRNSLFPHTPLNSLRVFFLSVFFVLFYFFIHPHYTHGHLARGRLNRPTSVSSDRRRDGSIVNFTPLRRSCCDVCNKRLMRVYTLALSAVKNGPAEDVRSFRARRPQLIRDHFFGSPKTTRTEGEKKIENNRYTHTRTNSSPIFTMNYDQTYIGLYSLTRMQYKVPGPALIYDSHNRDFVTFE